MEQAPSQAKNASATPGDDVKNHAWMIIAVVGIFNISVGYFFGHRYRPTKT